MESILHAVVVVLVFLLSTYLFKKAAGTLKITKLNMISVLYYFILSFNLIGASLVFLGSREHYMIRKIVDTDTISLTYYAVAYTVIVFPLFICLTHKACNRLFQQKTIVSFIAEEVSYKRDMRQIQILLLFLLTISLVATAYVFFVLGRFPIVDMFRSGEISVLGLNAGRYFSGNQYIKNIFMLMLAPFLSYYAYIYYRLTLSKTWRYMFFVLAVLSVIVLTYDFSKAPIINYLLGLYLINVLLGHIHSAKQFKKLVIYGGIIILFFYMVMMNVDSGSILSIYFGPVGRIIFSQIGPLFLHFEIFPLWHPFLYGASFNSWLSFIIPNAAGIRSGRIVMETYNRAGVEAGTAGVMNTLFIGEAYANYGFAGILIAPVLFGVIIGFVSCFLPSLQKRPTTVLLYVELTMSYITIVEGGFVDIIYNAHIIIIILLFILLDLVAGKKTKTGI